MVCCHQTYKGRHAEAEHFSMVFQRFSVVIIICGNPWHPKPTGSKTVTSNKTLPLRNQAALFDAWQLTFDHEET